jgi:hypothetical protein
MPPKAIKGSPWRDLYVHMLKKSTTPLPLFVLGGLAAFILTLPAMADTIYTYTGPAYSFCSGAYGGPSCDTHNLTVTFDLTTALGDGLLEATTGDISSNDPSEIKSWSFTDNTATVNAGNLLSPAAFELDFSTNGSGVITNWVLQASSASAALESFGSLAAQSDYTYAVVGGFGQVPQIGSCVGCTGGSWNVQTSTPGVPEPKNVILIALGLIAMAGVQRKLQRARV